MAKMTGLGKGLDALFGPAPEEEQVQENDTLKTFLFNDDSLSNTYFNFKLVGSRPSVNDVYNEIR